MRAPFELLLIDITGLRVSIFSAKAPLVYADLTLGYPDANATRTSESGLFIFALSFAR
jgi:hypothetical protein